MSLLLLRFSGFFGKTWKNAKKGREIEGMGIDIPGLKLYNRHGRAMVFTPGHNEKWNSIDCRALGEGFL